LRLSNRFGTRPLRLDHVTVGISAAPALASSPTGWRFFPSPVVPTTRRDVRFGGRPAVAIAAGTDRVSDRIGLGTSGDDDVVVSFYSRGTTPALTMLAGSAQANSGWVSSPGDHTADDAATTFGTSPAGWSVVSAVDVLPAVPSGLVVAFGDSLTEGYGSTPDANHRYPDILANRLAEASGGDYWAVNAGISANRLVPVAGFTEKVQGGPPGMQRFAADALAQSGVTDVLLVEGVNDIIISTPVAEVINAYRTVVKKAHARGVRVIAGTLPPSGDLVSGDPLHRGSAPTEQGRAALNDWIRRSGAFDGVVDFDAAVRDPSSPGHWRVGLSIDGLHPNDFGYRVMAEAVDLSLFRGPRCR